MGDLTNYYLSRGSVFPSSMARAHKYNTVQYTVVVQRFTNSSLSSIAVEFVHKPNSISYLLEVDTSVFITITSRLLP